MNKKYLDGKRDQFFFLNVEPGRSYYLHTATRDRHPHRTRLGKAFHFVDYDKEAYVEQVDQASGSEAVFVAGSWADFALEDIPPKMLLHLHAQPKDASDTINRPRN